MTKFLDIEDSKLISINAINCISKDEIVMCQNQSHKFLIKIESDFLNGSAIIIFTSEDERDVFYERIFHFISTDNKDVSVLSLPY